MVREIEFRVKTATEGILFSHLLACNTNFTPPLSEKVDLAKYSKKIFDNAITFEAWKNEILVGLVAAYYNDPSHHSGFITNVSLIREFMGKGIATSLISHCIDYGRYSDFSEILLEVQKSNTAARKLYKTAGFVDIGSQSENILMKLCLKTAKRVI